MKKTLGFFLVLFCFQAQSSLKGQQSNFAVHGKTPETFLSMNEQKDVIYGEDNRVDVFESQDRLLVNLSRSTAAMMDPSTLKNKRRTTIIKGKTLEERGICKDERFSNQLAAARCSGFLVAPNVLVTAGHCIKSSYDCKKYKWVFDYKVSRNNQKDFSVPKKSIYACKRIIEQKLTSYDGNDYAVIELDRNVKGREPLKFRTEGKLNVGDSIAVIGHPSGLPTKIADGASVRSLSDKYFVANLDTYGGNSGSAVFNSRTGLVEGILVRGERDYVRDPVRQCMTSKICENNTCRGEDVTFITNIDFLRK